MRFAETREPAMRRDPFGRGLQARRAQMPRESCPHVPDHAEGRLWLAGWDLASGD